MGQKKSARVSVEEGWMQQTEAARALKVTRNTVLARAARGRYRTKRIGGVLLVKEDDVRKDIPDVDESAVE